jgi:hypothetical protein
VGSIKFKYTGWYVSTTNWSKYVFRIITLLVEYGMETGKILVINYRCKVKGIPFNFFFQAEL